MNPPTTDLQSPESVFGQLIAADDAYTNDGTPIMSDVAYDILWQFAKSKWPGNSYFDSVGSQVRGGKIDLPVPMPSLDQVQIGDFAEWLRSNGLHNKVLVVTKKLDGVSVLLQYNARGRFIKAYSRGDGLQGADITRHVQHLDFPKQIDAGHIDSLLIRGEIMCNQQGFEAINDVSKLIGGREYANPRNTIAGLLNSSEIDPRMYKYMSLFVYQAIGTQQNYNDLYDSLDAAGFRLPLRNTIANPTEDDLADMLQDLKTDRYDGYECDGLVIYVDNHQISKVLDHQCEPGDNPKSAIKYKIAGAENQATSIVLDVEWDVSKDGYFKPRVKINPVKLLGTTVQYCTGFNARFIVENGVVPGALVSVTRSGDVIPFLQKVEGGCKEQAQKNLPRDGKWNETLIDWVVDHTQEVSQEIQKRIGVQTLLDFFSTLEVANMKEGSITTLYDGGFTEIVDIIHADEDVFVGLIGSNGSKIYKSLHEKLGNIDPWVLYGAHPAFGRGVGTRKFKALFDALGSAAKNPTYEEIVAVEGFQDKTARKILEGLPEFNDFLTDIYGKYKFRIPKAGKGANDGKFNGMKVCMTGFRDANLQAVIEAGGGEVQSSVSSKTTVLITKEPNSTSTKAKKARENGTTVISLEQFKAQYDV